MLLFLLAHQHGKHQLQSGFKIRGAVERVLSGADRSSSAPGNFLDSERVLVTKLSKRCLNTLLEVLEQYVSVQSPFEQIFAKKKLKNCKKIKILLNIRSTAPLQLFSREPLRRSAPLIFSRTAPPLRSKKNSADFEPCLMQIK